MSGLRVIYIGGTEHTGSTILGIALGNHAKIECVGELSLLPRIGWFDEYKCACGLNIQECFYWKEIREVWEQTNDRDISTLLKLENAIDRNKRLPRVMIEKYVRTHLFSKYCVYSYALFSAIQEISGKSIIVDTSKRASRALALSMVDGIDLRLIHLVRDARGVAYSLSKPVRPKQRTWWYASSRWLFVNTALDIIRTRIDDKKARLVRYEDFISTPLKILEEIGDTINVDLSSVAKAISRDQPLASGHMVGNDSVRLRNDLKLRSRTTWPQKMPEQKQKKIWWLTGRKMRRYGYSF
jgi:hypothetical protein